MEHACRVVAPFGLGLAKYIERDSTADVFSGAHAVDRFLHLAVTPVATFHRVGRRRQQLIVEEREGLFQVGAGELLEQTCSETSSISIIHAYRAAVWQSRHDFVYLCAE
jgi:hypothetical protein